MGTKEGYFLMFLTPCAKAALHKFPSLKKIIHTLPLRGIEFTEVQSLPAGGHSRQLKELRHAPMA